MTKTCNARSCRTSRIWGAGSRRAGQTRKGQSDSDMSAKSLFPSRSRSSYDIQPIFKWVYQRDRKGRLFHTFV